MAPELILIANEMTILIIVILALVLFGGSRIAGVGKGAGRAIREFKEETKSLDGDKKDEGAEAPAANPSAATSPAATPPVSNPPAANPTDSRSE